MHNDNQNTIYTHQLRDEARFEIKGILPLSDDNKHGWCFHINKRNMCTNDTQSMRIRQLQ